MGRPRKRRKIGFGGDVFGRGAKALQLGEADTPPENVAATGDVIREHGEFGTRTLRASWALSFCKIF